MILFAHENSDQNPSVSKIQLAYAPLKIHLYHRFAHNQARPNLLLFFNLVIEGKEKHIQISLVC
jgi:hypothetical protein